MLLIKDMAYDDKQINDFLELAQEVGITKAKRDLGYPNSWYTGKRWADLRKVDVAVDEVKQRAAATREWYKDEELLTIAEQGLSRVYEDLTSKPELTADDQAKLAKAFSSYVKDILTVQGRSTNISETRSTDNLDEHLQQLLFGERKRNLDISKEDKPNDVIEFADMS